MRRTSICFKGEDAFVKLEPRPKFQQMDEVLTQYLSELADHIIADCINPDQSEADTVGGIPGPGAEAGQNTQRNQQAKSNSSRLRLQLTDWLQPFARLGRRWYCRFG